MLQEDETIKVAKRVTHYLSCNFTVQRVIGDVISIEPRYYYYSYKLGLAPHSVDYAGFCSGSYMWHIHASGIPQSHF